MVVAVLFDIANEFHTIPHSTILEGLKYHGVPQYLQSLVADYLQNREVFFVDIDGQLRHHQVESGVPQESVLGPLLWNLGYNWLLLSSMT